MRRSLFAVMTACVGLASLSGLAQAETAMPQVFVVHAAGGPSTPRSVVAAGAVDGVGMVILGGDQPGPGESRIAQTTWVFPEGSLFVTLTYTATTIQQGCFSSSYLTGTWRITGGTGRYADASGGGIISGPISTYSTQNDQGCTSTPYLVVTRFVYQGTVALAQPTAA